MNIVLGIIIPFIGTVLGSGMVFVMKNKMNSKVQKLLLGFASGVMIAASVWSLLIPSIEMTEEQGNIGWIPAAIGFLLGMAFLLLLDSLIPHMHLNNEKPEGVKSKLKKTTMLVLAVTLHNIPEGISISVPIYHSTNSKKRALLYTLIASLSEPLGAVLTGLFLVNYVNDFVLGLLFALIAGIMIQISSCKLLPTGNNYNKKYSIIFFVIGFMIMLFSLQLENLGA